MSPPAPALLATYKLDFDYPEQRLFRQLSISIPAGVTLVSGDGGAGKTTLLRLLAGELRAQSGERHVDGISLASDPESYRQRIFLFDPRSTAFEAQRELTPTQWFQTLQGRYPSFDNTSLPHLTETLGVVEHLDKPFFMLSTGSRRKVWLAAAFASGARVLLLDEPFGALDKPSITALRGLIGACAARTDLACVVAHYEAPCSAPLAATINLDALADR